MLELYTLTVLYEVYGKHADDKADGAEYSYRWKTFDRVLASAFEGGIGNGV